MYDAKLGLVAHPRAHVPLLFAPPSHRTATEWQSFFADPAVDVPVTAVLQPESVWEDEQLAHREMTIDVPLDGSGVMRVPRTPLCMGGVDFGDKAVRGPALGEHNHEFGL